MQLPRAPRAALLAAVVGVLCIGPAAVRAAEPQVSVVPAGPYANGRTEITVTGSGFDAEANGGVGVYLVFGPQTEAPTYYTDAELYIAARWIHAGATDAPGQAPLAADGSFTTTLTIEPTFVDGHGTAVDCLADPCVLITMAAHGVDDRTQDTFAPITFLADATPAATPTVAPTPAPSADAVPSENSPMAPLVVGSVGILALAGILVAMSRRRNGEPD